MEDVFKTLGDALNPNQKGNVKPLYKKLDEERTQGTWHLGNTAMLESPSLWVGGTRILVADEVPHEILSGTTNAKYAALAVNNLAPLAEALTNCVTLIETFGFITNIKPEGFTEYTKAKAALKAIS